jgi:hypothetical protein
VYAERRENFVHQSVMGEEEEMHFVHCAKQKKIDVCIMGYGTTVICAS